MTVTTPWTEAARRRFARRDGGRNVLTGRTDTFAEQLRPVAASRQVNNPPSRIRYRRPVVQSNDAVSGMPRRSSHATCVGRASPDGAGTQGAMRVG